MKEMYFRPDGDNEEPALAPLCICPHESNVAEREAMRPRVPMEGMAEYPKKRQRKAKVVAELVMA